MVIINSFNSELEILDWTIYRADKLVYLYKDEEKKIVFDDFKIGTSEIKRERMSVPIK